MADTGPEQSYLFPPDLAASDHYSGLLLAPLSVTGNHGEDLIVMLIVVLTVNCENSLAAIRDVSEGLLLTTEFALI